MLHNNVGVLEANFTDQLTVDVLPEDVWETVYQINLRSYFLTTKYAAPHLKASPNGPAVVNTASVSGLVTYPMGPAYAATKGGRGDPTGLSADGSAFRRRCEADVVDVAVVIEHGGYPHADPRVDAIGEPPDEPDAGHVVELDHHRRQWDVGLGGAREERPSDHGEGEHGTMRPHRRPVQ